MTILPKISAGICAAGALAAPAACPAEKAQKALAWKECTITAGEKYVEFEDGKKTFKSNAGDGNSADTVTWDVIPTLKVVDSGKTLFSMKKDDNKNAVAADADLIPTIPTAGTKLSDAKICKTHAGHTDIEYEITAFLPNSDKKFHTEDKSAIKVSCMSTEHHATLLDASDAKMDAATYKEGSFKCEITDDKDLYELEKDVIEIKAGAVQSWPEVKPKEAVHKKDKDPAKKTDLVQPPKPAKLDDAGQIFEAHTTPKPHNDIVLEVAQTAELTLKTDGTNSAVKPIKIKCVDSAHQGGGDPPPKKDDDKKKKKDNTCLIVCCVVGGVVLIGGIAAYFLLANKGDDAGDEEEEEEDEEGEGDEE